MYIHILQTLQASSTSFRPRRLEKSNLRFLSVPVSYTLARVLSPQLSVVSHAVANIMKRVLVVLLLYLGGSRRAGLENFFGLLVCVAGLFLYAWDKRPKNTDGDSKTSPGTPSKFDVPFSSIISSVRWQVLQAVI